MQQQRVIVKRNPSDAEIRKQHLKLQHGLSLCGQEELHNAIADELHKSGWSHEAVSEYINDLTDEYI